ncbi:EAL domain-containing protein [Candidatus Accumulibacter phosphatis]|jgi:EAL domain-containing protein (putative c-di-GMP-specific phosphodiesterase class I)|uniref:EAL domain-containing protein n=1 Tax=Candidatus Accumulibacter phosphatis TaxID=327160 RepID=A0ABX1U2F3_9PROT|nr:EAL domain-containing protein [Candidatus Accumulibacter phosphatis]
MAKDLPDQLTIEARPGGQKRRLPFDELKIDQSFVHHIVANPGDAAIARTIVALGQSLGLRVIAEGVENEEQREFLASIGCVAYQGYHHSARCRSKASNALSGGRLAMLDRHGGQQPSEFGAVEATTPEAPMRGHEKINDVEFPAGSASWRPMDGQ